MGKTGTTNDFRDALFVGSTCGIDGITVAVRIGFDDNRSLGSGETGARLALPVFREVMMAVYREQLAGPVPRFPAPLEARITTYLLRTLPAPDVAQGACRTRRPILAVSGFSMSAARFAPQDGPACTAASTTTSSMRAGRW